jgi:hypothetical protein
MELFIPSLIVLILGALFAFIIIPKMSPYVLGGLALSMFVLGLWQHYAMFPYEYKASMATDILKQYSGFIMLAGVIFAGTVSVLYMHGSNPPAAGEVMPELPAMPNLMGNKSGNNTKNNTGGIFNLGGNNAKPNNAANPGIIASVTNAVNGVKNAVVNGVTNATKAANNAKKNNLVSPSFKSV